MPNILLVDDEHDLTDILSRILSASGYGVATAHSADDALCQLEGAVPDLILLDVDMPPGRSGKSLAQEIPALGTGPASVPIVFMSGHPELRTIASDIGTPYFIAKPCELHDLLALVQLACHERLAPVHR